jgi:hypothetical protein
MVVVGLVALAVAPGNAEAAAGIVGGGLGIALLNVIFRLGAESDRDRDREEAARRYFDEHGHWPDEAPRGRGPER